MGELVQALGPEFFLLKGWAVLGEVVPLPEALKAHPAAGLAV